MTRSQVALPVNPLAKREEIPLLAISGALPLIADNPYAFRIWPSSKLIALKNAEFIKHKGYLKIAALSAEDEYSVSLRDELAQAINKNGAKLTIDLTFALSDTDYGAALLRVKREAPDVVFLNLALPQLASALKKYRELGIKFPVLSNAWVDYPAVLAGAGDASQGIWFADFDYQKAKFLELFRRKFPASQPIHVTYACYAAFKLLGDAFANASEKSKRGIFEEISKFSKLEILDESLTIRGREVLFPPVIKQIIAGRSLIVAD